MLCAGRPLTTPGWRSSCCSNARGELIDAVALVSLDRALLVGAGALAEPALRALDAIHVVSAVDLHPIDGFVTYDERQAAAARLAGLRTIAPGA